ncbi:uncharacterized protein LOC124642768 [Helicoverpa zea]|uniref:uncharacterized protein LOC124635135 n=1 Tax=Helicoverpa zea TaxID=7113 RepID=UPI001F55FDD4|nr:uncharacterized protein LOC124635135 [Helicoverpa zea]XP_047037362.1 uncharacterized protein LOC124642768 [Helicoverpa zea]
MDSSDEEPNTDLPDSQPFFTEIETDVDPITDLPDGKPFCIEKEDFNPNISLPDKQTSLTEKDIITGKEIKRHATLNEEESQSLLAPKRRTIGIQMSLITVPQSKDTQKPQEEPVLPSQNSKQQNVKYQCVPCNITNNQKDMRNEYYGKLISSELDFVEPCMRTYVYVEILKLIHRNKHRHMPHEKGT